MSICKTNKMALFEASASKPINQFLPHLSKATVFSFSCLLESWPIPGSLGGRWENGCEETQATVFSKASQMIPLHGQCREHYRGVGTLKTMRSWWESSIEIGMVLEKRQIYGCGGGVKEMSIVRCGQNVNKQESIVLTHL